jgi:hypothetical protein
MKSNAISPTVTLVEFNEQYTPQLSNFYLPEDQLEFTSLPLEKNQSSESLQDFYSCINHE